MTVTDLVSNFQNFLCTKEKVMASIPNDLTVGWILSGERGQNRSTKAPIRAQSHLRAPGAADAPLWRPVNEFMVW